VPAPDEFEEVEGSKTSMRPSMTRNDVVASLRGKVSRKKGRSTAAVILVSFPTSPQLSQSVVALQQEVKGTNFNIAPHIFGVDLAHSMIISLLKLTPPLTLGEL